MRKVRRGTAAAFALLLVVALAAATVAKQGAESQRVARNASAELVGAKASIPYGAAGVSESGEAVGAAVQDYENRAYPNGAVAFAQTQGSIKAAKAVFRRAGAKLPRAWDEVGTSSLDVDTLGTQHFLRPTEWSGRVTAMRSTRALQREGASSTSPPPAAASGARTSARRDAEVEGAPPGWTPRRSATIVIDPNDRPETRSTSAPASRTARARARPGIGLYRSTDSGNHWTLVPGSRAAAANRGIGGIVVDPSNAATSSSAPPSRGTASRPRLGRALHSAGRAAARAVGVEDGGASFQLALLARAGRRRSRLAERVRLLPRRVTDIEVDPQTPGVLLHDVQQGRLPGTFATPTGPAQIFTEPMSGRAPAATGSATRSRRQHSRRPDAHLPGPGLEPGRPVPVHRRVEVRRTDDARRRPCSGRALEQRPRVQAFSPGTSAATSAPTTCRSPRRRAGRTRSGRRSTQYQELPTRAAWIATCRTVAR